MHMQDLQSGCPKSKQTANGSPLSDFSANLAKSKLLGIIGWFKKSEVELQCLTGEGLKLGLARIIGENLEKNEGQRNQPPTGYREI